MALSGSEGSVSGPCPICETWIEAERFQKVNDPTASFSAGVETPSRNRKLSSRGGSNVSGRIRAGEYPDHNFNGRRELFVTLRMLAAALAVLALISFVALYMKQWIRNLYNW